MKTKEKCIYKNKNGKIIQLTDFYGYSRYVLLDSNGNYKRDIQVPFRISDYL